VSRTRSRGAVLAELVVAFPVLLLAYLCFLQMAQSFAAALAMRHATVILARYASVTYPSRFIPKADRADGTGGRNPQWDDAVTAALGAWKDVIRVKAVSVEFEGGSRDPWGNIQSKVDYEYSCHVPIGKFIVCKNGFFTRTVRVVSPLHGATYSS
jgi:hypothetical protein